MSLRNAPLYGQVVVGPPGSGKTTYCNGMQQYLNLLGRNALVVNFDPANEAANEGNELPYSTLMDVCQDVVNLSSVMKQLGLGPNGGLVYCIEYMEAHIDDIIDMLSKRIDEATSDDENRNVYLIFDLPGQIELYTHATCIQKIMAQLQKRLDLRLAAVQLVDAFYCTDATKFISAALLGTTTMLRLELPMVNVLSKVDILAASGEMPFSLEYFTECQDLQRLVPFLNSSSGVADFEEDVEDYTEDPEYQKARAKTRHSSFFVKHAKMTAAMAEVVEDFGLLSFIPLNISDAESVGRVLARIDKCNGYVFVSSTKNSAEDLFSCAIQNESSSYEAISQVQERIYTDTITELQGNSDTRDSNSTKGKS